MADIDELRAKVIASMAASNPNSKPPPINSSKAREEGELSSSDTDENRTSSAVVTTGTAPPPVEPTVTSMVRPVQVAKADKIASLDFNATTDAQRKTSVKHNNSNHFQMKTVPPKPGSRFNPGWTPLSVSNNNLVISFSDDDSESDSEEQRLRTASEKKENRVEEDRNRRISTSSHMETKYMQHTANNQIKRLPRKGSLSRTFTSSTNKFNGKHSMKSGPSADDVYRIKNPNPLNKVSASREQGHIQGANLNSSKLEDLRQQIAIRENQIRLANQSKSPGLHQDHNGMHINNNDSKKGRLSSANSTSLKGPDKKRPKLIEPYQRTIGPDSQQVLVPATKSVYSMKKPLPEKNGPKDRNLLPSSQCTNEKSVDTTDPVAAEHPGTVSRQIPVFPGNPGSRVRDGKTSLASLEKIPSLEAKHKVSKEGTYGTSDARSEKNVLLMDSARVLNPSLPLTRIKSSADGEGACQLKMPSPKKSDTLHSKVPNTFGVLPSTSLPEKAMHQHGIVQTSECNEVIPGEKSLVPLSERTSTKCADESPFGTCLFDSSGQVNLSDNNHINIEALFELEESYNKDLEEAQEHRHRCELEERNALIAYRKAQRALIVANGRCTQLYRRRELFSAQFRASIMDDSSSLWYRNKEPGSNLLNDDTDTDANLSPTCNNPKEAEFRLLNWLDRDSNMEFADGAIIHASCQQRAAHNLDSELCSEPDANGVCTHSNHTNVSADGDEEAPLTDHQTAQSRLVCENSGNFQKSVVGSSEKSKKPMSVDKAQDYALLEASLRSELFARLGTKTGSKHSEEHTVTRVEGSEDKHPSPETEQHQTLDVEGNDGSAKDLCSIEAPDPSNHDNSLLDHGSQRIGDPDECSSSLAEACMPAACAFSVPSSVFKLAFSYVKFTPPSTFRSSELKSQEKNTSEEEDGLNSSEFQLGVLRARFVGSLGDMGSYTCNVPVDPFWPLCMFELRGKCNDDQCPWQHVKDYNGRSIKQLDHSTDADSAARRLSDANKVSSARSLSLRHQKYNMSAPELYLAGLDLLEADSHATGSFLGRRIGQCWQKGFSTSYGVPFNVQRNRFSDARLLRGDDRRRLGYQKKIRHNLTDSEQSLDLALALFGEEVNKLQGKTKALSILSQALESDPTSVSLWIVYLHIFYWDKMSTEKDDMFSLAIRNNESSYGLWLMYINSRVQLDGRLVAYDSAISALCRHASSAKRDTVNASACILDLFLQMVDCLSMSGNVQKAIRIICGLLTIATDPSYSGSLLLSNILACLTTPDKCIFWASCVYVVIYKKLPDAVVQQFEVEKELPFSLEWRATCLMADEKQKALELMKIGMDSVAFGINSGEHEREVHSLAVNHVQCVAVLEGQECSKNLLEKYIKLYPTCLELVLSYVMVRRNYLGHSLSEGFEEALHSWSKEVPGVQCIWNQYVQCALENGEFDLAEQLMTRWSQSFEKVDCPKNEKLDDREEDGNLDYREDDGVHDPAESPSRKSDISFPSSNPKDELFGLLNLALHRLLQKDRVEARLAIDKALSIASCKDLNYCLQEHAVFVSSDVPELVEVQVRGILNLMNRYLVDPRFLPACHLLSRKFCQDINDSRIRELINKLLGQVTCDYTLVNSILEACYGESLLPERSDELKYLVDVVEALMELFPANYRLALSACKLISRNGSSSGVASASVVFWASTLLVNSLCQTFPVAPEHVWVEAAGIVSNLVGVHLISERFHQQALSSYPFSVNLWKSWYNLSKLTGNGSSIVEAARERGINVN